MLVIFDNDGVLVDSEVIAAQVNAEAFARHGYEISAEDMTARFAGYTGEEIVSLVEDEMGRGLPDDLLPEAETEIDARLARELKIVDGVAEMLDRLEAAVAVCSNSGPERLEASLKKTGLWDRFRPYVYSARAVGEPKPAPDVYLHALGELAIAPEEALVVEDSTAGVEAARSAGIRVIGFTGASHTYRGHAERLMDAGAETVAARHGDLPAIVQALSKWSFEAA